MVVDLDEVRDKLVRARCLLDAGNGAEAAAHAARSAALARLHFLPNHDGDWVDGICRELGSILGRALEFEARGHRCAGDLAAAAAAAERLVRAEPFSEAGHQLRIRILAEAGDRAGAIKAYEHCRTVLADELGVEPSAETEAAFRAREQADAIRPEAATFDRARGESTARPAVAVPFEPQMTPPRDLLVGRTTEVRRLRAALDRATAGSRGVVLVSGDHGVGKTRLVEAPGQLPLLLDLGTGVASLGRKRHEARPFVGAALVTHLHFDHVLGLPFFEPFNQPGAYLDVYGPRQPEGSLADAFAGLVRPPYFPVPLRELRGKATFLELANDSFSLGPSA